MLLCAAFLWCVLKQGQKCYLYSTTKLWEKCCSTDVSSASSSRAHWVSACWRCYAHQQPKATRAWRITLGSQGVTKRLMCSHHTHTNTHTGGRGISGSFWLLSWALPSRVYVHTNRYRLYASCIVYGFLHWESACLFLQALTTEVLNGDSRREKVPMGYLSCPPGYVALPSPGAAAMVCTCVFNWNQIYFPGHNMQEEVRFYLSSWTMLVRESRGQSQLESVSQLEGFILVWIRWIVQT